MIKYIDIPETLLERFQTTRIFRESATWSEAIRAIIRDAVDRDAARTDATTQEPEA